jgi:sugar/nucleoside kinase (ribokinase family)
MTLGSQGAFVLGRDGTRASVPAPAVSVVDTVGAGDYFCGGFMAAYMRGASLRQCAAAGCASGGCAVQSKGAQLSSEAWDALESQFNTIVEGGNAEA